MKTMASRHRYRGRRPQGRRSEPAPTYAALDLGTNNCRLLLARPTGEGFRVVDAFSRIVRLGEGLGTSGRLSDAAIERTVAALRICAGKMRSGGVTASRHVATEACRRADNGSDFLRLVREETGLELEVIDAVEEARLAMAGCLPLIEAGVPYGLVFDIGGGSTEIIWLRLDGEDGPELIDSLSIPCGVVTFAEHYSCQRVGGRAYLAMVQAVQALLAPFEEEHGIAPRAGAGEVRMVGTSGTVTTLASLHMRLPRYDRAKVDGAFMSFAQIEAVNARLARMDRAGRAALGCVGRERADLVVAGSAILEGICRTWPAGNLRVADRGLREGILVGLMGRHRPSGAPVAGGA